MHFGQRSQRIRAFGKGKRLQKTLKDFKKALGISRQAEALLLVNMTRKVQGLAELKQRPYQSRKCLPDPATHLEFNGLF